jgi:zinc protease
LDKDRYVSYEDNIRAPMIDFAFPTVPARSPDEAPLDVLADVLAGGKSSIFYQNFVKSNMALSANAGHPTAELAGSFDLTIRTFPDKSLAQMDSLVRYSLLEFEKRGVTDDDIKKYLAGFEAQMINSLSSVQGKGAMLASNETFTGNANYIVKEIERYNKVTKEDVMRVYNTYIKNKFAVVLSVCPKGKSNLAAKPDNYKPLVRDVNAPEAAEYKNLVYTKAKDNFDRSKKPTAGPNPVVKAPDYWKQNFDNGLKIIGAKSDEVPSTTLQLSIEAGHRYEKKEQSGISQLLTSMMNESTQKHTAEEIGELLEKLGSSVSIGSNGQDLVLYVSSLTKNLDATLAIAEEMLFQPKFDAVEFERVKKQRLEAIANQVTQATTVANNVYAKLLYGSDHVMGVPSMGTKETVSAITLEDVKKYYAENISPSISSLVIVGDVSQETILPKINFLKNWKGPKVVHAAEAKMPVTDKTKIYFVNKDKAPQSEIRIGFMSMPYDATGEFYKSGIMNFTLGGAFNSRINLNLREAHGFTYGARSSFQGNQFVGPYTASAGVRGDATDSSVVEFMKEIKLFADKGITDAELAFTKNSMGQNEALKYETSMQKAGFVKRILDYNLEKNYTTKQNDILKAITKEEINSLAKKQLQYDKMAILVVGDKSKVYLPLTKLGYDVIELDADGNEVKEKKEEVKVEDPKKPVTTPRNAENPR